MKEFEWHIKTILETKITEGKRALVVEGKTDELVFTQLLKKVAPQWETRWVLAEVGGKRNVIEILSKQPTWLGIVDRDEWDNAQLNHRQQQLPNLLVLPRFCIENYLVVPSELLPGLPPKQRAKLPGESAAAIEAITSSITANLESWIQFGTAWAIINPLWDELRSLGFNRDLLDPQQVITEPGFWRIANVGMHIWILQYCYKDTRANWPKSAICQLMNSYAQLFTAKNFIKPL
ncbi:hypothetical protein [Escherichia coli]|uniref:hypothetical protein n=1 Tax=Escherichia coli TaxID=562 RepID=UPI003BF80BEC|nr:DUF4435 domain-containing protein [Escherichia coli]